LVREICCFLALFISDQSNEMVTGEVQSHDAQLLTTVCFVFILVIKHVFVAVRVLSHLQPLRVFHVSINLILNSL
jgi:hypothetical protein